MFDERDYERAAALETAEREAAIEAARRPPAEAALESGGVRYCLACEEPIDPRRLAVLPQAVRCIGCEELHQKQQQLRR